MGKTLLKMQISTAMMVLDGKETMREGRESTHVHGQGMWFKSLDLKTASPEKLAIMESPPNSLCPTRGPGKPQSALLETAAMQQVTGRTQVSSTRPLLAARPLAVGGSGQTAEVSGMFGRTGQDSTELTTCQHQQQGFMARKVSKQ